MSTKLVVHIRFTCNACYRPKRSFGQGNVFTGVCHSVNRGGVPDQAHPPSGRYTPRAGTPPLWQVHPPGRYTPPSGRYTPSPWQVHPPSGRYTPLAGTPPGRYTPPLAGTPPWQVHPLAGTPPGRYTPPSRYTPPAGTPSPGRYTPPRSSRPRNTVNDRPVCILLECILVFDLSLLKKSVSSRSRLFSIQVISKLKSNFYFLSILTAFVIYVVNRWRVFDGKVFLLLLWFSLQVEDTKRI